MIILLSPAKSLEFDFDSSEHQTTTPVLLDRADKLAQKLKKYSAKKIGTLMSLSPALSDLNYQRYQDWAVPFNDTAKPALLAFRGDVYRGMGAQTFSKKDLDFAQNHLRILSGLYGVLKPLDLMLPYRLEMGTRMKVTPKVTNLYKYWGDVITDELNKDLEASGSNLIVNVASNEYFKAVNTKKLNGELINCAFKDNKNGEYKAIMTFAKLARGYMSRYLVKNKITDLDGVKAFAEEGYVLNRDLSDGNDLVFTRG